MKRVHYDNKTNYYQVEFASDIENYYLQEEKNDFKL